MCPEYWNGKPFWHQDTMPGITLYAFERFGCGLFDAKKHHLGKEIILIMKILFCNITYSKRYTGNIEVDYLRSKGIWVRTYMDIHEKWNFLNIDGNCYGYAMNKGNKFQIQRLEGINRKDDYAEDVLVVWCALKPSEEGKPKTVIVGWYEHARVYRCYQSKLTAPGGMVRHFFVTAKAEDCYLLPESRRTYVIDRVSSEGRGRGFGQCNMWYADSEYAKEHIVPEVAAYLEANRAWRINEIERESDVLAPL